MFGKAEVRKALFEGTVSRYEKIWSEAGDKLHKKKLKALKDLQAKPRVVDQPWGEGMEDWKYVILNKKLQQLIVVETIEEIDEVMLLPKHHRNTIELPIESKYWLLEEECLFWSIESSKSPLSADGYVRYMKCFDLLCKIRGIDNPLANNEYYKATIA